MIINSNELELFHLQSNLFGGAEINFKFYKESKLLELLNNNTYLILDGFSDKYLILEYIIIKYNISNISISINCESIINDSQSIRNIKLENILNKL